MILGIDAHNLRAGGGITHLINLLIQEEFYKGFEKIYFFGGKYILGQLDLLQPKEMHNVQILHQPLLDKGLIKRIYWQQYVLPKILNTLKVDILFSPGGILPLFVPSNIKTITMCHNMLPLNLSETLHLGLDLRFLRFLILRLIQKISFAKADGIIFISNYAKKRVQNLVPNITKFTKVIYHGINPNFYNNNIKKTVNDKIELCYVSTIDVYKHQWQVVKAMHLLKKKGYANIHLNLIGGGYSPAVRLLNKTIKKFKLENDVTWKGIVSYLDLPKEYHNSSIFVFASSCENCPNILLEAMAAGLPIACSSTLPMPEFTDENSVQYFDPLVPESIAKAISYLIDNPDIAKRKAINAYEQSRKYTWKTCAGESFDLIDTVYKTEKVKAKTWLIGPLPPPLLGQSLAFKMICDYVENDVKNFKIVNIGGENLERRDGSFSVSRTNTLINPFFKSLILPFLPGKNIYLTIAQSWVGFLRDFVFIFFSILGRHHIILHLHGGNYDQFYNNQFLLKRKLIKWTLSKADKIIVLSNNLISMFSFLPDYLSKVKVVPNGLPYEDVKNILPKIILNKREPIKILYLSNLIVTKGYLDVLDAMKILKEKTDYPVECNFCGKFLLGSDSNLYKTYDEAKDDFMHRIKKYGLENQVKWKGSIDGDAKIQELKDSHFFILPTNYNNEGQPISIIEAMAYGLCVITTKYRA
ncbi:MAG: group glycosyltransferase, partial [uncultured bacterium]